jgi:hypothetical protein
MKKTALLNSASPHMLAMARSDGDVQLVVTSQRPAGLPANAPSLEKYYLVYDFGENLLGVFGDPYYIKGFCAKKNLVLHTVH